MRQLLLKDSKICQLEQINDNLKRKQELNDIEKAWIDIGLQTYLKRTENEKYLNIKRLQRELEGQECIKQQIYDRIKAEKKQLAEEIQREQESIKLAQLQEVMEDKNVEKKKLDMKNHIAGAIEVRLNF